MNQRAPSGPAEMPPRTEFIGGIGRGYNVIAPAVVMRPMLTPSPAPGDVNHNAPSGPAVMSKQSQTGGTVYSVITPDVVIRPIFPISVNQSAPSGPSVMFLGYAWGLVEDIQ